VVRYRREDDGLTRTAQLVLLETLSCGRAKPNTLLFDQGIHRTGNPAEGTTLMVSVYETPLRRLYLQRFDLENEQRPPRVPRCGSEEDAGGAGPESDRTYPMIPIPCQRNDRSRMQC
jgi:hypothetical protein